MSPIKDFKLKYEAVNRENTFTAGDTIKGTVTFTLTEEIKVQCLFVKAKGDANVHWSESHGSGKNRRTRSYNAHRRYYKAKQFLVAENKDGTVLSKGDHRYQFELKIPEGNIPPSFKGFYGKILHVIQAKMSRSWHTSTTDRKDIYFASRTLLPFDQSPQTGSVEKSLGTFSKGDVHLSATVDKRICSPGDILQVTAKISNQSSKTMKIKFKIEQKIVYRARGHAKIQTGNVCKIVGEAIEPGFKGDVACPLPVPPDTSLSILNCQIITVEFYVKAYLDVSFASDPKVVLPLIVAAPGYLAQQGQHGFPNPPVAVGGSSNNDFLPSFPGPYSGPAGIPNAYSYPSGPSAYPNMPPNMPGGGFYNPAPNYMPPQPAPYGYPTAPYMPYPVVPQVNPQFPQDQAPPTYTSLYPSPQSGTDMEKKSQL